MPHSSGGGSSGGGFHSGGGSSGRSGPSYRTSRTYFPGATCYVYYDSRYRMRTLYTNADPSTFGKRNVGAFVGLGLGILLPIGILIFTGFHNPSKISVDYPTSILIQDNTDVLSEQEEVTLKATFNEFFTISGICPSFVSIDNATWSSKYASLQGYAYDKYISMFVDESHWLIVYSDDGGNKANWKFEGMQGYDTDNILSVKVTDQFNSTLYNNLSGNAYTIGGSIDNAFRSIMPTMMDSYFGIDPGMWVFCGIFEGIVLLGLTITIINTVRNRGLKNAVKVTGSLNRHTCEYCGTEYAEGSVERCPKCGALVDKPHYASYHPEEEGK